VKENRKKLKSKTHRRVNSPGGIHGASPEEEEKEGFKPGMKE